MNGKLKIGSRIQLWPADTYPKYGIVRKITPADLTIELTYVHSKDPNGYKAGDVVTLQWSKVRIQFNNSTD